MVRLRIHLSLMFILLLLCGVCFAEPYDPPNPDVKCKTEVVRESDSRDNIYKISVLRVTCGGEETASFRLKIEALKAKHPWWTEVTLENDERLSFEHVPTITWQNLRTVEIAIKTRTLSGLLQENMGDDLIIRRKYIASEPNAFPNY